MTDMLEKVARAICAGNINYAGPRDDRSLEERVDEEWPDFLDDARAAVQALMEPDEVMVAEGVYTDEFQGHMDDAEARPAVQRIYRAMLQTILHNHSNTRGE